MPAIISFDVVPPIYNQYPPFISLDSILLKTNDSAGGYKHAKEDNSEFTTGEQDRFQAVHMEWATTAFAEELEALRTGQLETLTSKRKQKKCAAINVEPEDSSALALDPTQYSFVLASKGEKGGGAAAAEEIEVQVLADMLQSGSQFLSSAEKKMLLGARQRAVASSASGDVVEERNGISLHDRRKRELGFVVE